MSTPTEKDPLAVHLESYEEAWTSDHEEVKRVVWTFEDKVAVGLALFDVIHSRYWTWRDRVVRGQEEYAPEYETAFKERFEWWLRPCSKVVKRLEALEAEYGSLAGAGEFRRKFQEALQILASWEPSRWVLGAKVQDETMPDNGQLEEIEPQPTEESAPQPEFLWSKARYRARKAAEEFSKETHADY
jgi:hypothetical protein